MFSKVTGVVVVVALFALATTSSAIGSTTWMSAKQVQRAFVGHWLWGNYCPPGVSCGMTVDPITGSSTQDGVAVQLKVTSARARGIGPSRLIGGVREWRLFTVYVCGRNYREGAEIYGGDMVRYTAGADINRDSLDVEIPRFDPGCTGSTLGHQLP